jgi:integrase/recombinase XerD
MKPKNESSRSSPDKVINLAIEKEVNRLKKRMSVAHLSKATIISYSRGLRKLSNVSKRNPRDLEYNEIIDYLVYLKDDLGLQWRTIKLYVAGLRYYYSEIVEDTELAARIPYPKEKRSLPQVMSRERLKQVFEGCLNYKHSVMFRLMYSAGLRRGELLNLKISDIESKGGKMRIRVNNGKGGKGRYTVLSATILKELRTYFKMCKPKEYLFNGQRKGRPMSIRNVHLIFLLFLRNSASKRSFVSFSSASKKWKAKAFTER